MKQPPTSSRHRNPFPPAASAPPKRPARSHWWRFSIYRAMGIILASGKLLTAASLTDDPATNQLPNSLLKSLPKGVLAWDGLTKEINVVGAASQAHFSFSFTNISSGNVTIEAVEPSCGCTTVQLPPLPWVIPAGANGHFALTVNLIGKARNQVKTAEVETDKGFQEIVLKINLRSPAVPTQSAADQAHALKIAKLDRQAIFRGNCTTCHLQPGNERDGRTLYYAVCAVCHEGGNHSPPAPDLFAVKTPTNVSFWLNWIAHGKPGTVMPAFSAAEGGPLSDDQIANLARYLNTTDDMDAE